MPLLRCLFMMLQARRNDGRLAPRSVAQQRACLVENILLPIRPCRPSRHDGQGRPETHSVDECPCYTDARVGLCHHQYTVCDCAARAVPLRPLAGRCVGAVPADRGHRRGPRMAARGHGTQRRRPCAGRPHRVHVRYRVHYMVRPRLDGARLPLLLVDLPGGTWCHSHRFPCMHCTCSTSISSRRMC